MKYLLIPLLFFVSISYSFSQEQESETDSLDINEYIEFRNRIKPPPPPSSPLEEFNVITCNKCTTVEDKKKYFDSIVFSLFNENIYDKDLLFLKKINTKNILRLNLHFEFKLSGQLIKKYTYSFETFKKERAIIDSVLHKFPILNFNTDLIDSTKSSIRYCTYIRYRIFEAEDGKLELEKLKLRSKSNKGVMQMKDTDKYPIYSGCKPSLDNQSLELCMRNEIFKIINENFNTEIVSNIGLSPGKKRLWTNFTITKDGKIEDIRVGGSYPSLIKEAGRIISLIPKFDKPGYYGNEPVDVKYSIPIVFNIPE